MEQLLSTGVFEEETKMSKYIDDKLETSCNYSVE